MKAVTSEKATGSVAIMLADEAPGGPAVPSPRRPLRELMGDGLPGRPLDEATGCGWPAGRTDQASAAAASSSPQLSVPGGACPASSGLRRPAPVRGPCPTRPSPVSAGPVSLKAPALKSDDMPCHHRYSNDMACHRMGVHYLGTVTK